MPRVYLIDNPQPNAFATGRNPENAAVAATTGLLQMLTPDELAGVMAHELAHIKNRDTLIMTISATIAGAISTLAQFGFLFGGRGGERPNPVVMIATAILAPLAAMIIQMAISRSREYDADRMGAEIAGSPSRSPRRSPRSPAPCRTSPTRTRSAIPRRRRSSSSIPFPATAWTTSSRPIPATENRIAALQALARRWARPPVRTDLPRPGPRANPWGLPPRAPPGRGPWG